MLEYKNRGFNQMRNHEFLLEKYFKDLAGDTPKNLPCEIKKTINTFYYYYLNYSTGDIVNYCTDFQAVMIQETNKPIDPNLNFSTLIADYNYFHEVEVYDIFYDKSGKFQISKRFIFQNLRERIFKRIERILSTKYKVEISRTASDLYWNMKGNYNYNGDLKIGVEEYVYDVLRYIFPGIFIYVKVNPTSCDLIEYYDYDTNKGELIFILNKSRLENLIFLDKNFNPI